MRKILLLIVLFTGIVSAQEFDFGCEPPITGAVQRADGNWDVSVSEVFIHGGSGVIRFDTSVVSLGTPNAILGNRKFHIIKGGPWDFGHGEIHVGTDGFNQDMTGVSTVTFYYDESLSISDKGYPKDRYTLTRMLGDYSSTVKHDVNGDGDTDDNVDYIYLANSSQEQWVLGNATILTGGGAVRQLRIQRKKNNGQWRLNTNTGYVPGWEYGKSLEAHYEYGLSILNDY